MSSTPRNAIGLQLFCGENGLPEPEYWTRDLTVCNEEMPVYIMCRVISVERIESDKDELIAKKKASYGVLKALFGLKRSIGLEKFRSIPHFRTVVNVLGDSIGAGLDYDMSKKDLAKLRAPTDSSENGVSNFNMIDGTATDHTVTEGQEPEKRNGIFYDNSLV